MNKNAFILCAAIWVDNGIKYSHPILNKPTGLVIGSWRHHNCIGILYGSKIKLKNNLVIQGFITSDSKFVDRKEAGQIAFEAGQIKEPTDCLMSEDLY